MADGSCRLGTPLLSTRLPAKAANKALPEMIFRPLQQVKSFRINHGLHFQKNEQGMKWHRKKEGLANARTMAGRAYA